MTMDFGNSVSTSLAIEERLPFPHSLNVEHEREPKTRFGWPPLRLDKVPATAEGMEAQVRVISVEADGAGPTVPRADAVF